jgi:hypothetical protein
MIHSKDDKGLDEFVIEMAKYINNNDYQVLKSIKELKKSSSIYFSD